jgi:hypothetical protein
MKTIGIVGGIGPESTIDYYWLLGTRFTMLGRYIPKCSPSAVFQVAVSF